jgi:putative transposase
LEPPEAVAVRGISKSAVSERFVYGTERKLAELMSRELREMNLVALMIDGVHFAEHVVLAAVGVDERGDKHVLDCAKARPRMPLRCGPCSPTWLSADWRPVASRSLLIVIDGAKALHKAVVEVFGGTRADSALS